MTQYFSRTGFLRRAAFAGVAACVLLSKTASASPSEQVAQALFDEARTLMEQQRFSEACPKLLESQRLDPGGGTLLNLAVCQEGEGKLGTALGTFLEALALAVRDRRSDREALARSHIATIEKKVSRLAVIVPTASDVDSLEVKLDGVVLRREAWGLAMPIDAGAHTVSATAYGKSPWSIAFSLESSERKSVGVPLLAPALPVLPGAVVQDVPRAQGVDVSESPIHVEGSPSNVYSSSSPQPQVETHTNPLFVAALGTVAIGLGTALVTGAVTLVNAAKVSDGCVEERNFCKDADSRDAAERLGSYGWVSTISLGVAAAAGISLVFISPKKTSLTTVGVASNPGGASAQWSIRF